MLFVDFSPPPSPSLEEQRDALQKGLGRAVEWAGRGLLDDAPLLEACLEDRRYDTQVEDSRGDWLWTLIRAANVADRFRVPILHALYGLSDERSAVQLCELARHYAEEGDDAFRGRLYEIVERKPFPDGGCLGEEDIIGLDGEAGFLFAVRVRGERLADRPWDWEDDALFHTAGGRLGEGRATELLEGSTSPAIRTYWREWQHENRSKALQEPRISRRDRMRAIPIEQILSTAESGGFRFGNFRGWGMYAEESELETVLRHLSAAREANVAANLLRVFSNRPAPQFVAPLLEFCRHADPEVRRRAIIALEQNSHPLIREFALAGLESGAPEDLAVGLFEKNFLPGDERRILEAIELPDDRRRCHGLLMDVIQVLEGNPDADSSRLAIVAYASTPCEHCRLRAARLLLDEDVAPGWLIEECRFDSNEGIRKLVADGPGQPELDSE